MGLNETVSAERVHIGFFGIRNAGKSSLVNAVTGQDLSVVSDTKGTTTDPVKKAMELLPLGPVVIIDTPGLDDEGELGQKRVKKGLSILSGTDIAVLTVDSTAGLSAPDYELIEKLEKAEIPFVIACTKSDLADYTPPAGYTYVKVSSLTGEGINELKELLGSFAPKFKEEKYILRHLIKGGGSVILVTPCDGSAPKGRLILPQQQVLREMLDSNIVTAVVQETELEKALDMLKDKPEIVVTDSKVFGYVNKIVPKDIMLTSFSVLFANYKGELSELVKGAEKLSKLSNGSKVLISEGCTHHRQCADIGTVLMPGWIREYSGSEPEFSFTSGNEFPDDLEGFELVVHCGGCMLNERAMKSRINICKASGVPIVNYGIAIAKMRNMLDRALEPFKI
ncbi:MAG: [Clostridia bacterium]|nr:[FeFe] hydrogenase H-cluster maturation GTPase HydF [Clostridia bacterium]